MEQIDDRTYIDRTTNKVTRYSGTIEKNRYGWCLVFQDKYYHGSYSRSYDVVYEMRKVISDKLGLTTVRDATMLECRNHLTKELKEYIAGFSDGDACIQISQNRKLTVGVYQSSNIGEPPVLQLYQKWFGGNINKYIRLQRKHKIEYSIQWFGTKCIPLLNVLVNHSIVKAPQALLALEWLTKSKGTERDVLTAKIKECKVQTNYQAVEILHDRITDPYLSGIYDADFFFVVF